MFLLVCTNQLHRAGNQTFSSVRRQFFALCHNTATFPSQQENSRKQMTIIFFTETHLVRSNYLSYTHYLELLSHWASFYSQIRNNPIKSKISSHSWPFRELFFAQLIIAHFYYHHSWGEVPATPNYQSLFNADPMHSAAAGEPVSAGHSSPATRAAGARNYFGHIVSGLARKSNVLRISEVKILVPRSNLQATHQRPKCGWVSAFRLSSDTAAPGTLQRGEKQQ